MLRIPHFNGSEKAARIEFRCPDPSCSPHLAVAAILAAGFDGVRKKLCPPEPRTQDLFHESDHVESLPESLSSALNRLEEDSIIQEILGANPVREFLELKRDEWERYIQSESTYDQTEISAWELREYLSST